MFRNDVHYVAVTYDRIETATRKAIFFEFNYEMIWLPKSQIEKIEYEKGRVWIPKWLANEHDLHYE